MIIWTPKHPAETVAFLIDWSEQVGDDHIASHTFTRTAGDATITKSTLRGRSVEAFISGGTNGTTSEFLATVSTVSGQVLRRTFAIRIDSDTNNFAPNVTSKRQLVEAMFNEVALNGWELDITPEEKDTALKRIDALMWELLGRGIMLGYNFPDDMGQGNLADPLGCPNQAFNALAILGGRRIAPSMGKKISQESREALNDAMKALRSVALNYVPHVRMPTGTPLGSGFKPWTTHYPFAS